MLHRLPDPMQVINLDIADARTLRAHINKEDNVLFPLADRLLTPEDQKNILVSFEKRETEEVGAGVHGKYLQLAHELGGTR